MVRRGSLLHEYIMRGDRLVQTTATIRRWSWVTILPLGAWGLLAGFLHTSWWFTAAAAAFFTWILVHGSFTFVPWVADFRPPILMLRSHEDDRTKDAGIMTDDILYGHRLHYMGLAALNFQQVCRVVVVHHEDHGDADNLVVVMTDDTSWESSVVHVARDAWAVVVFPADSPGCLRELELLKEHKLLDKVAVYMPASSSLSFRILAYAIGQPKSIRRYADDWEELRLSMQSHGYNLPGYYPAGLLYKPLPDFSVRKAVSLGHNELSPPGACRSCGLPQYGQGDAAVGHHTQRSRLRRIRHTETAWRIAAPL